VRLPRQRRRPRRLRAAPRSVTATCSRPATLRIRVLHTPGHTFTHLSYALEVGDDPSRRLHRRVACCTAPPAAPTCSARTTPRRSPACSGLRPPARRPSCPTRDARSSRPTASARSARRPRPRPTPPRSARSGRQPGPDPGRGRSTSRSSWPGLDAYPAYYAHMGPANAADRTRPTSRPRAADAGRAAAPDRRGRVGRRPAHPHGLRAGHVPARSTSARRPVRPPTSAG
jgi:hydroxyacylglutathione hydrolase